MKRDPVVDEVRAVRHRISERFGHDTKALMDHYRQLERQYSNRMLREPPLRDATKQRDDGTP